MALINDFQPRTILDNTNGLVAYLPDGRLFAAKNIEGTNLRKLYQAFASEYTRLQNKIYELGIEDDLANTSNLIDEWERALLIPDTCLTNNTTLVQRRKQVVAKFALMNLVTEEDWIALARFFGYTITISRGVTSNVFTMTFPIYFTGSIKAARFTMIIKFVGLKKPSNIFTCTFPIVFSDNENFLMCLFYHLKPANVHLQFDWEKKDDDENYLIDNDSVLLFDNDGQQLTVGDKIQ